MVAAQISVASCLLSGFTRALRNQQPFRLTETANSVTCIFRSGFPTFLQRLLDVKTSRTEILATRRRRDCFLRHLLSWPGANRISMMQYQRLFGGAERLMLVKEPETDYYRSGEIPMEHADPGPSPASPGSPSRLLSAFTITLQELELGCESAAVVKVEKCSIAVALTCENMSSTFSLLTHKVNTKA